jgi:hypothetical protein
MVLGRKSVAKLKQALGSLMPEMDEGESLVAAAPVMELREIIDPLPPCSMRLRPDCMMTLGKSPRS